VASQVDALKEKVGRYVLDLIGPYEVNDRDEIHFRWGSAHVFLKATRYGDDESVVFISIPFLFGLAPTPELFRHVALHADDWHFGHLSLTENRDDDRLKLWLTHSLLGDYLDVEELKTAVATMAKTADQLDDELRATFGGDRYHED
jgi:Putative bacterial sensory transduction regulator